MDANENPLFKKHRAMSGAALALMERKNHDYATGGGGSDPLANFRLCSYMGVASVERGILVRMSDKLGRAAQLIDTDPAVAGETLEDTLLDLINYSVILAYRLQERD